MFTAQHYRDKAQGYDALLKIARSSAETAEYRDLQQSYTSLADNLDWMAENADKTVGAHKTDTQPPDGNAEHRAQENILRALGAAVILNWNTIPMKLQRALFDAASSVQGAKMPPLREALAQFLHDHKDDAGQQNGG